MTRGGSSGVRVALVTAPDEVADDLARSLVRDGVAACVNVLPGVRSHYRWEGRLERADESLLVLKLPTEGSDDVPARVAERHPYDVPEVLLIDVADGLPAYLRWVVEAARDPDEPGDGGAAG